MEIQENAVNEVISPSEQEVSSAIATGSAAVEPKDTVKESDFTPKEGVSEKKDSDVTANLDSVYKPNFKVKAYDNEYEIPEKFRSYINKENEKEFKDVFEKAFALDEMKGKYHKTRESYQETQKVNGQLINRFNQLGKFVDNKDYDSFFKEAGIPDVELQRWMLQKLQMKDLPPEQQQVYNNQQELRQKAYQLEMENQRLQSEYGQMQTAQQQQMLSQRVNELDKAISAPEVSAVAKSFDSRLGQPGAFKNEVINRAAFVYQTQGKDLSVEEAVKEVLKIVAWNTQGNPGDNVVTQQSVQQPSKPTLPNVAGKATSPAAQKVKSIDDLRKIRSAVLQNTPGSYNN